MRSVSSHSLPLFAVVLWTATAIGALVHAQATSEPKALDRPLAATSAAAITDADLKKMLVNLGYTPKDLSKGYQITIKKNNWTFNIQVVLSDNKEKLGMNTIAGDVKQPMDVPAASWLALLETNPDIDPTTFYFDKKQNRLCLHRACDNRGVTQEIIAKELDSFCFDVVSTSRFWRFTN
jgi:hypothetical protein